jgi:hypothetical protein
MINTKTKDCNLTKLENQHRQLLVEKIGNYILR